MFEHLCPRLSRQNLDRRSSIRGYKTGGSRFIPAPTANSSWLSCGKNTVSRASRALQKRQLLSSESGRTDAATKFLFTLLPQIGVLLAAAINRKETKSTVAFRLS